MKSFLAYQGREVKQPPRRVPPAIGRHVGGGFPADDIQATLHDLLEARGRQDVAVQRAPTIPASVFESTGWLVPA